MKALHLLFTLGSQSSSVRTTLSATAARMSTETFVEIDPFCFRQFAEHESSKTYSGTVFDVAMEDFVRIVNEKIHSNKDNGSNDGGLLKDGYAPFCKHLFLENDFTNAKVNVVPITPDNEHLLACRYEARNARELPVLIRYFPRELIAAAGGNDSVQEISSTAMPTGSTTISLPKAKYLDLILYSREQIEKENAAQSVIRKDHPMEDGIAERSEKAPWGIVSIKAQDVPHELPMTPITAMRNALGKEEGGSGIPLNREQYMEAYNYWNAHAIVS